MKKIAFSCLLLVACSQGLQENINRPEEKNVFALPDIGIRFDEQKPDFIQVTAHSKFDSWRTQEPVFDEGLGAVDIENFCPQSDTTQDGNSIMLDCKIIAGQNPHIEFYFSQFNPYNDDYGGTKKYALFKTKSILKPVVSITMPIRLSLSDEAWFNQAMVVQALRNAISDLNNAEAMKSFSDFANTIHIDNVPTPEQEWFTYSNKSLHFSFDYPNGASVVDSPYASGAVIMVDKFVVHYEKNSIEAEAALQAPGHIARTERVKTMIGHYSGEKISFFQKDAKYPSYENYLIPSPKGYFIISYENYVNPYLDRTLNSFTILD